MKIPSDLFENKQLKLSPLLIKSYIDKLNVLGKFEESKVNLQGSIGGNEEDEAINHFVGRFPNGAVRSQYVVIDSDGDLNHIASQLATVFSDKTLIKDIIFAMWKRCRIAWFTYYFFHIKTTQILSVFAIKY